MKLNDTNLALRPQQVSVEVLLEKYAKGGETSVRDVRPRVAQPRLACGPGIVKVRATQVIAQWCR